MMKRIELYKFPKGLKSRLRTYGIHIGRYDNVKFIEIEIGRNKWRLKYVPKPAETIEFSDDEQVHEY